MLNSEILTHFENKIFGTYHSYFNDGGIMYKQRLLLLSAGGILKVRTSLISASFKRLDLSDPNVLEEIETNMLRIMKIIDADEVFRRG